MKKDLQDTSSMSKIAGGDLVAIDPKYQHNSCLSAYKKHIGVC